MRHLSANTISLTSETWNGVPLSCFSAGEYVTPPFPKRTAHSGSQGGSTDLYQALEHEITSDAVGPGLCPEIMRKAGSNVAADQTNAMLAPPEGG